MPSPLDSLRTRIAELDAGILKLVAERLRLVQEVGREKRNAGLPVRSFTTEQEVLSRFRESAQRLDVDPAVAEQIARILISTAVRVQEEGRGTSGSPSRKILIVGGAGKMGQWLSRFFANQGHAVVTFDPAGPVPGVASAADLASAVRASDVVLVAAPLTPGAVVLREIIGMEPAALVADIFSLKSHVQSALREAAGRGLRVASVHPLFGPEVKTLGGRVIAVCDCGNAAAAEEAEALFRETALTVTRMPVQAHDAFMQYVLGLSHLTALLFAATLERSGLTFPQLASVASTTFYKEARTAAEVVRENPYLYFEIQNLNDHSRELFALVGESLRRLEVAALAGTPDRFVEIMRNARAYFPDSLPPDLG